MQQICCEYGSGLLMLEAYDDIVEEWEVEADRAKGHDILNGDRGKAWLLLRTLLPWAV